MNPFTHETQEDVILLSFHQPAAGAFRRHGDTDRTVSSGLHPRVLLNKLGELGLFFSPGWDGQRSAGHSLTTTSPKYHHRQQHLWEFSGTKAEKSQTG